MITPYTIAIPQADLDDVQARLAHVRWTTELPGVGANYGEPLDPIKRLVTYWREGYDWRIWETKLNAYPQFTTTIDGQNIHFLHIRSKVDDALPLILTHGWPTSVVDYLDLIGPLTDPRSHGDETAQAFHLVIPSLPGFGFSGPTHEVGWNQYRTARAWAELMHRLGYDRYGAHGNDWGSVLSPEIGRFDPEHVLGSTSRRSSQRLLVTQLRWMPCLWKRRSCGKNSNGGRNIEGSIIRFNPISPRPWLMPWPTRQ